MEYLLRFIRAVLLGGMIFSIGLGIYFLFDKHFAIHGVVSVAHSFNKKSAIITDLNPNARLGAVGKDTYDSYQEVIIDPVYFNLKPPIAYDNAHMCVTYSAPENSVLYMGPQTDEGFNYDLEALQNNNLDELIDDPNWSILHDGDVMFLQRQQVAKQYASFPEFLDNLPDTESVAVFNYNLDYDYRINSYVAKEDGLTIDTTLRGPHTFITYVKDEPLDITFTIQDLNRHEGEDPFGVVVLKNGKGIYSKTLPDDGFITATDPSSAKRTLQLYVTNLEEGPYTLDLHTNQDIFIRKIETAQSYFVVKNNVYLADSVEYEDGILDLNYKANTLFTNGNEYSFRTTHKSGLQTLEINQKELVIDETHTMFYHSAEQKTDLHQIYIPDNDVIAHVGGLMSFTKDSFFDPYLLTVDEKLTYVPARINYVIARYSPPIKIAENVFQACRNFVLPNYYIQKNSLKFIISMPGLVQNDTPLKLYKLDTQLTTQPLYIDGVWQERIDHYYTQNYGK